MAFFLVWLILSVVFAAIGAGMAKERNKDPAAWALICALTGLIGIIALAFAKPTAAQTTNYTQPLRIDTPAIKASPATQIAPSKTYDEKKWLALLDVDDDLAQAATTLAPYHAKFTDEFAEKYLALDDKTYLRPLLEKIVTKAKEAKEEEARLLEVEKQERADAAGKIYFEYLDKLKGNNGFDPDYHLKVAKVERYMGGAKAFQNGVKLYFEDGTLALKGGFLIRKFATEAELEAWGR